MKRKIITSLILPLLLLASCQYKQHTPTPSSKGKLPKGTKLIGYTPVKDQGKSSMCWAYAMLATIESEHIMKGDSIDLSVAYIARKVLHDKALDYYFSDGKHPIKMRGMGSMLIRYIEKYGAAPYDSYEDPKDVNYSVLARKVERLCKAALAQKTGLAKLHEQLDDLLNTEMGYLPAKEIHMLGATYTPLEFAHSICYPEEYVSLTSFTHHPFRDYFALEMPDNELHDLFLNLPLDELMLHVKKALEKGHPVCWEGDTSEPGFKQPKDNYVDIQPVEKPVTQASRQREFEMLRTTDDHVMEIIGMFKHGKQTYFVCKNSWGENYGNHGLIYLSEDYLRLKTVAVYMSEAAYLL